MTLSNTAYSRIAKYMAAQDKMSGGLGDTASTQDFSDEQIAKGLQVEREHTNNPDVALEIVIDHLTENPEYYTWLEEMENEMKTSARIANHLRTSTKKVGATLKTAQDLDDEDLSVWDDDITFHVNKIVSLILETGEQAFDEYMDGLTLTMDTQAETYFRDEVRDYIHTMVFADLEKLEREALYTPATRYQSADYKGKDDPYKKDVVERQDDWMRMDDDETNLENWKHLDNNKVTDYKKGQTIDPVEQLFDYVLGTLHGMLEIYQADKDDAQYYADVLEQVMNVIDPLDE